MYSQELITGLFLLASTASPPLPENVKIIEPNQDGTFAVTCIDNTNGTLFYEDQQLCAFSKGNYKNQCDIDTQWSLHDAASYVCSDAINPSNAHLHEK